MIERTLSIVKPDAVHNNAIGAIIECLEKAGLTVIGAKMAFLTKQQAEHFYAVHKSRPFFGELVSFITSGPVLIMTLEGQNAIAKNREVMGATNPQQAAPGTIRARFGKGIEANAVHGSDAKETAAQEIAFFFPESELFSRASK